MDIGKFADGRNLPWNIQPNIDNDGLFYGNKHLPNRDQSSVSKYEELSRCNERNVMLQKGPPEMSKHGQNTTRIVGKRHSCSNPSNSYKKTHAVVCEDGSLQLKIENIPRKSVTRGKESKMEVGILQCEVFNLTCQMESLRAGKTDMLGKLEEANKKLTRLENNSKLETSRIKRGLEAKVQEVTSLIQEFKEVSSNNDVPVLVESLQKAMQQKDVTIEHLRQELSDLKSELQEKDEELKFIINEFGVIGGEFHCVHLEENGEEVGYLNEQHLNAQRSLKVEVKDASTNTENSAQEDIIFLRETAQRYENTIQTLQSEIADLKNELQQKNTDLNLVINEFVKTRDESRLLVEEKDEEIRRLQMEYLSCQSEAEETMRQDNEYIQVLENEVTVLKDETGKLYNDNVVLKLSLIESMREISDLFSQNESLGEKVNILQNERDDLENKCIDLYENVSTLEKKLGESLDNVDVQDNCKRQPEDHDAQRPNSPFTADLVINEYCNEEVK